MFSWRVVNALRTAHSTAPSCFVIPSAFVILRHRSAAVSALSEWAARILHQAARRVALCEFPPAFALPRVQPGSLYESARAAVFRLARLARASSLARTAADLLARREPRF